MMIWLGIAGIMQGIKENNYAQLNSVCAGRSQFSGLRH